MGPVDDVGQNAADRGENIDRGVVKLTGQICREDNVSIENRADLVGHRFIEIIACDEHRVERCDRTFVGVARAFEKSRKKLQPKQRKMVRSKKFTEVFPELGLRQHVFWQMNLKIRPNLAMKDSFLVT